MQAFVVIEFFRRLRTYNFKHSLRFQLPCFFHILLDPDDGCITILQEIGTLIPESVRFSILTAVYEIYRFLTMVYQYNCHNFGHYPSFCLLFKMFRRMDSVPVLRWNLFSAYLLVVDSHDMPPYISASSFYIVLTIAYGGISPQLILGCRWYAPLLTRSVNTQLALCGA
jgi:hypothetical protein